MDYVTQASPLSGMISRPMANIRHKLNLQAHKNLTTIASADPEIIILGV